MATNLSGSLSEFGLAEVLSLLSMGGRTARTRITSPGGIGTVHLVDGQISSATDDASRAVLLRALVAATPVSPDDLAAAVAGPDPVRTLVESAAVDRDLAQHVAGEQCAEAIGRMLRWDEGHFEVQVGELDPGDIGLRIETQGLTDSAEARNRQWQEVRGALPAPGSVLALAPDITEQPVIETADWAVLARVDGHRTLEEVLAATGASPLTAGRRLVGLLGRGLVAVQVVDSVEAQQRSDVLLESYEAALQSGHPQPTPVAAPDSAQDERPVATPAAVFEPGPATVHEPVPAFAEEPAAPTSLDETGPADLVRAGALAAAYPPAAAMVSEPGIAPPGAPSVAFVDPRPETGWQTDEDPGAESDGWTPGWADTPDVVPWSQPAPAAAEYDDSGAAGQPGAQEVAVPMVQADLPASEPGVADEAQVQLADPVASLDEAGAQFAWSPWAQEMGLGEGPAATAPPAEPTGGGYAADTDAMPHPQAPSGTGAPRGDVAVAGAAAAGPESSPMQHGGGPEQDPLAEGLLAQLMSSVRGM